MGEVTLYQLLLNFIFTYFFLCLTQASFLFLHQNLLTSLCFLFLGHAHSSLGRSVICCFSSSGLLCLGLGLEFAWWCERVGYFLLALDFTSRLQRWISSPHGFFTDRQGKR